MTSRRGLPAGWLFDPEVARRVVLARRPGPEDVVGVVVSDEVWTRVVGLLRWADGAGRAAPGLTAGVCARLAADCAALLHRLPALLDELGEGLVEDGHDVAGSAEPADRVQAVAAEITELLLSAGPVRLPVLADTVFRLGAAAISVAADRTDWSAAGLAQVHTGSAPQT